MQFKAQMYLFLSFVKKTTVTSQHEKHTKLMKLLH